MNHMTRYGIVPAAAFQLALLSMLAVPAVPTRAADTVVKIANFTFSPQQLKVKAGTTVTWVNEDDIPHTIASSTNVFKSKVIDSDDRFSFTFTTAGTFEYFCSLHAHMTGSIVVEAQ
ncbi:MAG: amicyanin [Xanthobacteraceae bacterium]|nr:MAG: amicyanin [Xanthobacteraceae bacterium]